MISTASEIQSRPVSALIPYVNNSRTHDDEQIAQIAASIREFGFTNPVLIDEDDGIIAGHGRLAAARKLKMEEVPCIVLSNLTEQQKRAYVIADNKLALNAGWDAEMLSLELQSLGDFDLSLTGFSDDELSAMFRSDEGKEGEDDVPDLQDETITQPGDVWVMGDHRLMCGDSTDIDAVQALMQEQDADLLITDPPYNVDYEGKTAKALKIQNDKQDSESFQKFLADAFSCAYAVMKPGASYYIWHADSEGFNFRSATRLACLPVKQCLVWVKDRMIMGRQDYHWQHEPCLYGWKEGASHLWATDRKQTTLLNFPSPQRSDLHPTMKPVALFRYQIQNNTRGNDLVLDLFGGSGTTAIACEEAGRKARLMELDPRYCDVIVRRWQEFTGEQAVHASNGCPFEVEVAELQTG